ncbi:MAG: dienelactone hydrolase family protein [Armatimonadota bacterium]|nr:dienelactone hydrolase family protein [Armatimonadota bacterium]
MPHRTSGYREEERLVRIPVGDVTLEGNLGVIPDSRGIVVFAHGSGSSRHSPRNRFVASVLREAGLATLLMDLLTPQEEIIDEQTRRFRFDIELLARRVIGAVEWVTGYPSTGNLNIGCFGASTGAAAALIAAAERPDLIRAVVSRGGRPDLAAEYLPRVKAPTLLIVGGNDTQVIRMNQEALELINADKVLSIVPGASHLFEEPGTLEEVARLAADWFARYLGQARVEHAA